jgi:hypothetical protein
MSDFKHMNVSKPPSTISKGRAGWRAETRITLPDVRAHALTHRPDEKGETKLTIVTSKRSRVGVSAFASVAFHGEHFTTHAMGMGTGLGDYGRTLLVSGARCTEAAVLRIHAEALAELPAVLEEVRVHYAKQEARRAAEANARA